MLRFTYSMFHFHTCNTYYTEPTLTVDNLTSLLEGVHNLDGMAIELDIPYHKQSEIKKEYGSDAETKQRYWVYWLTHHPCPSWTLMANALYRSLEHEILQMLLKMYLKGRQGNVV